MIRKFLAGAMALAISAGAASALTTTIIASSTQGVGNNIDLATGTFGAPTGLPGITWEGADPAPVVTPPPASLENVYKSPWDNTTYGDGGSNDKQYFSVGGNAPVGSGSPRTVKVDEKQDSLTFLWGSIDSYNTLSFSLNNSDWTDVTGQMMKDAIVNSGDTDSCGDGPSFECVAVVTFTDVEYHYLKFTSQNANGGDQAAFEFAAPRLFVTTSTPNPVPLPAGVWLMGTALAGFGFASRRRKAS